MIKYPDGSLVCVGDRVLMNQGREPGVVHAMIDTPEMMETWGHEEAGLVVDLTLGGLNFWPAHSLSFVDEIRFVSRDVAEPGAEPNGGPPRPGDSGRHGGSYTLMNKDTEDEDLVSHEEETAFETHQSEYYVSGKGHYGEQIGGYKPVMTRVHDDYQPHDSLQTELWDSHILVEVESLRRSSITGRLTAVIFGKEPHLQAAINFCRSRTPPIDVIVSAGEGEATPPPEPDGPKIPCVKCGSLILPATAKRNDGMCTRCQQSELRSE